MVNRTKPLPSWSLHSSVCRGVRRHAINRYIQIVINVMKKNKGIESGKFYFKWPDKRNLSEAVVLTEIEFRRESRYSRCDWSKGGPGRRKSKCKGSEPGTF